MYEVDGRKYQLELSVFHGSTTSLSASEFVPQGQLGDTHTHTHTQTVSEREKGGGREDTLGTCTRSNVQHMYTVHVLSVGAVAMVNSMECLNWLEQVLVLLWIPGGDSSPPTRGCPW